jgi:hypothetical protein
MKEVLVEDEWLAAELLGNGQRILGMIERVERDGDEERAGNLVIL